LKFPEGCQNASNIQPRAEVGVFIFVVEI